MKVVTSDGQGNILSIENTGNPRYQSLDSAGALATLMVVLNLIDISDAANAVHTNSAHLEHEALAWSIG
jgi:hypothetical protein